MLSASGCTGNGGNFSADNEKELRNVYETYLAASVIAYQTNDISPIKDMIVGQELQNNITHIESRKESGIVRGEISTITRFEVLYYGDTIAAIQVDRRYIALEKGEKVEDFPDYLRQSDTQRCELVRETTEQPWKINYCEYVITN